MGSGLSIYKGIEHMLHPQAISNPVVNYIVLSIAMMVEAYVFVIAIKEFNKSKGEHSYLSAIQRGKDPGLFVVLLEDAAAMMGLVVAMIGIAISQLTGNYMFDGIASIIIGLILAMVAVLLAYETKGLLIGESANKEVVKGINDIVEQTDGVQKVNEVLTMHMGPEYILVNLSVEFSGHIRTGQMEHMISQLDREIKLKYQRVNRVFIEAETKV